MNISKGFTLVEMMATVGVATVLLAIATPSFVEMSRRNRMVTYANDFIASVNLARSEAIRRGEPVTICHSNNASTCSGTWSDGWIIFQNKNGDSPPVVDAGEPILRTHEALSNNYTLGTNPVFANGVIYGADGAANNTGVFAVCYSGSTIGARAVILTRLRPRTAQDSDGNHIPNKDDGDIADCTNP